MDALFVVPTIISPNVMPKLVPVLCKVVERNIALQYASVFREAVKRYFGFFEGDEDIESFIGLVNSLSEDMDENEVCELLNEIKVNRVEIPIPPKIDKSDSGTKEKEEPYYRKPQSIETPSDIIFFSSVSLEPTVLVIPYETAPLLTLRGRKHRKAFRLGIKCIPFAFKGVSNVVALLLNNKKAAESVSKGKIARMAEKLKRLISTKWAKKYTTDVEVSDQTALLQYTPDAKLLRNPRAIAAMWKQGRGSSVRWAPLLVLSTLDISESKISQTLATYQDLVKAGFGDIIIVNEAKDSIFYCMQRLKACQQFPLSHLRSTMELSNIIELPEVSRWTKRFSTGLTSIRSALTESNVSVSEVVERRIINILHKEASGD